MAKLNAKRSEKLIQKGQGQHSFDSDSNSIPLGAPHWKVKSQHCFPNILWKLTVPDVFVCTLWPQFPFVTYFINSMLISGLLIQLCESILLSVSHQPSFATFSSTASCIECGSFKNGAYRGFICAIYSLENLIRSPELLH